MYLVQKSLKISIFITDLALKVNKCGFVRPLADMRKHIKGVTPTTFVARQIFLEK